MTPWSHRPSEEKALLNPSFCSMLLWHAATAYVRNGHSPLRFDLTFLVLPFALHRGTRESLPRAATTSLPVWLQNNPLASPRIADRARILMPFTKEALIYGGIHGLLGIKDGMVAASSTWKSKITAEIRSSSDEVRDCAKKAEFIGKWFASAGSPDTVMAIIGIRP